MKTSLFLVLVWMLCIHKIIAQPGYTKADSVAVFDLLARSETFFEDSQFDSAIHYCHKAASLAQQKNFKRGQTAALTEEVEIYIDRDELDKAETYAIQLNKMGLQMKDSLVTATGWVLQAQVKMYSDQFESAVELFEKAIQYYLSRNPAYYSALAYNDLGYTWGRLGELSKQVDCLIKSIQLYETYFPDKQGEIGVGYSNLSTVYYTMNDRSKAIEYAKKSLPFRERSGEIGRLSLGCCNISQLYVGIDNAESEKYLQLCVKYALQANEETRIIHSYITASNLYGAQGKYEEALQFELKAIDLLDNTNKDPGMLARRYLAAGIISNSLKKDTTLITGYFNKSFNLLQVLRDRASMRDFYGQLTGYYSSNKNYPAAYESYKKYIAYRDSLVNEKTQSSIAEITTRYESEKKDNEIIRLTTAQRIKQLEIEKQKAVIAGNTATALQKQNEIDLLSKTRELLDVKIRQKDEELEKQLLLAKTNAQQLELTEKENLLREKQLKNQKNMRNLLLAAMGLFVLLAITYFNRYQLKKKLEQQKSLLAMRNNISQDLHDDIGASLSNINILNELAKRNIGQPEKSKEYLSKASEDIQRISESLSDIVWNINPRYDDLQNLFVRMKRYAADMLDGKNISGQFDFPVNEPALKLSMPQRRDLYLLFKEAINNLVKYSKAQNASIKVAAGESLVSVTIKDDGVGFDRNKIIAGNGLQNMEQRAKASGGSATIISASGKGTTVQIEMKLG